MMFLSIISFIISVVFFISLIAFPIVLIVKAITLIKDFISYDHDLDDLLFAIVLLIVGSCIFLLIVYGLDLLY